MIFLTGYLNIEQLDKTNIRRPAGHDCRLSVRVCCRHIVLPDRVILYIRDVGFSDRFYIRFDKLLM